MSRRGGGRSRSRSFGGSSSSSRSRSSSPSRNTPAPAPQQQNMPMQQPQQGGGGLMSNVASGIFSGITFGTGSAIAHRAMDGIMGPRTVEHVHTGADGQQQQQPMDQQQQHMMQQQQQQPMMHQPTGQPAHQPVEGPCGSEAASFRQCMDLNNYNVATCTPFMDALQQCQRQ